MKYSSGYKYQLKEIFELKTDIFPSQDLYTKFITLRTDGTLKILDGYAWDGASGPTWDTDNTMTPSLVHDAFYQLLRAESLDMRWILEIDMLLHQMLLDRGMWTVRAWYWQTGLEIADGVAALPKNSKKILTVD